jgi:hypothetical protein
VAARLELHRLQLLMGQALVLGALGGEPAQVLRTGGQRVARALEPAEVEQARRGLGAPARGRCQDVREAVGHDRRDLALEPSDLLTQRLARRALAFGACRAGSADQLPGRLAHRRLSW